MPVDFHALAFESRRKVNPREGTEIGFVVQEREMCWHCYGSGVDHENPTAECSSCKGVGFIVEERSLSMALAALGITATENADAFWLSNNLHPANHRPSKYHGLKIYASCPPDAKPDHPPYAIILKINPQASLVDGVEFLGNVIDGVMKDFFFKYATGFEEVSWVYRDLNGFLYIIKTDHEGRIVRAKKIASNWDGSNFLDIGIDFQVDNRLQLMIQEAISHI